MKWLYLRWGLIFLAAMTVSLFGVRRYDRDVKAISPERLLRARPTEVVRVIGRVEAGTIVKGEGGKPMAFQLSGEGERISVRYRGDDTENLRDLKTLVMIGKWDPTTQIFEGERIGLTPNYGFITAAYLVVLVPLGLFLFGMERKVARLYILIKEEKVYQPEGQA
ncbi:MAG: cytochrome c maturation protein CcmE [Candidatus Manganitrophaceae bacterium]